MQGQAVNLVVEVAVKITCLGMRARFLIPNPDAFSANVDAGNRKQQ